MGLDRPTKGLLCPCFLGIDLAGCHRKGVIAGMILYRQATAITFNNVSTRSDPGALAFALAASCVVLGPVDRDRHCRKGKRAQHGTRSRDQANGPEDKGE